MSKFKSIILIFVLLFAMCGLVKAEVKTQPVFYSAMEGSSANSLGETIYGLLNKADYLKGKTGKGMLLRRYGYDSSSYFNFANIKGIENNEGSILFWFNPTWDINDNKRYEFVKYTSDKDTSGFSLAKNETNNFQARNK